MASFQLLPQLYYGQIFGADYVPLTLNNLSRILMSPSWGSEVDMGWSNIPFLQYFPMSMFQYFLAFILGGNTLLIEKITWWGLYAFLSVLSSYKLSGRYISTSRYRYVSSLIFSVNTYSLMILSGGQIAGVGLAYALSPLVVYCFLRLLDDASLKKSVEFGITTTLLIMFDMRITYIIFVSLGILFVLHSLLQRKFFQKNGLKKTFLYIVLFPAIIILGTQAFWIIPSVLFSKGALGQFGASYTSSASLKFFSFAYLENTISFLHPNWPENFFGKTYFMRPEFLILPAILLLGAICVKKKSNYFPPFLIFTTVLIVGAFLAKGVNPPFGNLYDLAFNNIPGFVMFRDPTKWFVLIAISYSVLIPMTLFNLSSKVKIRNGILICFVIFYMILIRPVFLGGLNGTYQKASLTEEFKMLMSKLEKDSSFSRVLWFPQPHHARDFTTLHPALFPSSFLNSTDAPRLTTYINSNQFAYDLEKYAIGYIVVYIDTEEKLFLKERSYSDKQYSDLIKTLSGSPSLKRHEGFREMGVFGTVNPASKIRSDNALIKINETKPDKYSVYISSSGPSKIIFSESFNPYWRIVNLATGKSHYSQEFEGLNSFLLPDKSNSNFIIEFAPRNSVKYTIFFSICVWVILIGSYIVLRKRDKRE